MIAFSDPVDPKPARLPGTAAVPDQEAALLELGRFLQQAGYTFTTVTPDTHALMNLRLGNGVARDLRGVFGWNRPFQSQLLPSGLFEAMQRADVLADAGRGTWRSRVRFSTVEDQLIIHSAFPTSSRDAVFFGPDTYRFVRLLRSSLRGGASLLEIGAGTGAAALCLGDRFRRIVMTDINPTAVRFARVNAALAGAEAVEIHCADLTGQLTERFDAIIANPPYMIDSERRWYRDGGDRHGTGMALRMLQAALPRLAPGGHLVLYTGSPIIDGRDQFGELAAGVLADAHLPYRYEELDVDVFGAELATPAYAGIERIAVVAILAGPATTTSSSSRLQP
jgi:release factor glutamine methyltransferase